MITSGAGFGQPAGASNTFGSLAPVQDTILSVFQESGWPTRIDDPLPPAAGQDPKLRLREVVKRLNRHQRPYLIRFRTDGRGKGILWEWERRPRSRRHRSDTGEAPERP